MKKFIQKTIIITFVLLFPNIFIGLIRLKNNDDMIPFVINTSKDFEAQAKKRTAVYSPLKMPPPMNDMSRKLIRSDSLIRYIDRYGSSNRLQNTAPHILFIGDSFFEDPRMDTDKGLQQKTNIIYKQNISYNIGNTGNSGFQVYNELIDKKFIRKPRVIIFEVVERHLANIFKKAPVQLRNKEYKTIQYRNCYADLLLGNNFNQFQHSKILNANPRVSGTPRIVNDHEVWFMYNKLTQISPTTVKEIADSMLVIRDLLKKDNIDIIYVIAPDKESVYPSLFGTSNLFGLHKMMSDRQIRFIDMLTPMESHGDKYYYDGDTHWNDEAISLLVKLLYQDDVGIN